MVLQNKNVNKKCIFGYIWNPENIFLVTCWYWVRNVSGGERTYPLVMSAFILFFLILWAFKIAKEMQFDTYWSQLHRCNGLWNLNQLSKKVKIFNFFIFQWGCAMENFLIQSCIFSNTPWYGFGDFGWNDLIIWDSNRKESIKKWKLLTFSENKTFISRELLCSFYHGA